MQFRHEDDEELFLMFEQSIFMWSGLPHSKHKFFEAMSGKYPKCIITDGDLAMKSAIRRIFPQAHHRLCAWHICNNTEVCGLGLTFGEISMLVCIRHFVVRDYIDKGERWTKKAKNVEHVNFQQCNLSRESFPSSTYGALSDDCRVRLRLKQNSSSMENDDNANEEQVRDPVRVHAKA
ncbi:hypothetical protein Lal_00016958 [Lupinus albus]|nr:hypothetical protein Lal_00016958 [Lupinus albus]